mgnify:CR=1 FL=1
MTLPREHTMSEDQPVTVDQVHASEWRMVMHLNVSDRHLITRQCVDFPRLVMSDCTPKGRRSKATASRKFYVGAAEFTALAIPFMRATKSPRISPSRLCSM